MEEIFYEIRGKLYDLYNTFSKARGEWNDGYTQGVLDSISAVSEVSRLHKDPNTYIGNPSNNENLSHLDLEIFKKNYFKKGFNK